MSMLAARGWSMQQLPKWLCWGAIGVAGLLMLLFILDLAIGWPFEGGFTRTGDYAGHVMVIDIIGIITAGIILYLGYNVYRDIR
jgi:hypothetical protein